jgi:hypothetical protein
VLGQSIDNAFSDICANISCLGFIEQQYLRAVGLSSIELLSNSARDVTAEENTVSLPLAARAQNPLNASIPLTAAVKLLGDSADLPGCLLCALYALRIPSLRVSELFIIVGKKKRDSLY